MDKIVCTHDGVRYTFKALRDGKVRLTIKGIRTSIDLVLVRDNFLATVDKFLWRADVTLDVAGYVQERAREFACGLATPPEA